MPKTARPHIHLVSDATGETLKSVAKAALVQFQKSQEEVETHTWALVRKPLQMERVVEAIAAMGGLVLFTIVDQELREILVKGCAKAKLPIVPVLDPVIMAFGKYLGEKAVNLPGRQHEMDAEYFHRIDAMHFTIAHDDGQHLEDLDKADIVLVGVSRTSKTPTCIYLARRGVKAANIPLTMEVPFPEKLLEMKKPLFVGLTENPERLVHLRRTRLQAGDKNPHYADNTYLDIDKVEEEIRFARKLFSKNNWPVIDVTRRSVEETAAEIMVLLRKHTESPKP